MGANNEICNRYQNKLLLKQKTNSITMKKIIKIAGGLICVTVLFFNVSLTKNINAENTDLTSITKLNTANAECVSTGWNAGYCWWAADICVHNISGTECDPNY